jgi:hypothetical protein
MRHIKIETYTHGAVVVPLGSISLRVGVEQELSRVNDIGEIILTQVDPAHFVFVVNEGWASICEEEYNRILGCLDIVDEYP